MLLHGTMPLHVMGAEGGNPGRGSHWPQTRSRPTISQIMGGNIENLRYSSVCDEIGWEWPGGK